MKDWIEMGFRHIADFEGYDHLLFIIALSAIYRVQEWRKVLILVTAFTLGHSLTLLLAALDWVHIPPLVIETLIPLTILFTAVLNLTRFHERNYKGIPIQYPLTLFFGLIHGLGFSYFFREMAGGEGEWLRLLVGFNLGLEAGQLVIVSGAMAAGYIAMEGLHLSKAVWNWIISGIIAGFAVYLLVIKMIG